MKRGHLHHLELWRDDATATEGPWPWLLQQLGYSCTDTWATGCTWSLEEAYVVLESGTDHVRGRSERLRSGMNHLALWAGSRADVDTLTNEAPQHGWRLLFADLHPHAGGPQHYAAFLEDDAGFEVELVAEEPSASA
ncbi:hypothetical protein MO973_04075 [Paenibacillus sp. TRM 82003]|uniref:VOC family protein n=1 Tax=Kineococcus sp. TRM81007 TaxID=2925831 RepID=UPI001F57E653|nr:VOC family protein [Kineococcus sp. TRM81007]MCI2237224.1 hypothetical protein [Kineococcus sp. TRM81007]MCI3919406.1 hypothetical protein [Paenibacillus sp. TRM 82003]